MENNNKKFKIPIWAVIVLLSGIWLTLFGWLLNGQTKLDAKVEKYTAEVSNYQTALMEIHNRLGKIETDVVWIKKFLNYGNE